VGVSVIYLSTVRSLGAKRPGRKADHSPPCSAEVKNAWVYTSTPLYTFTAWCLVKYSKSLYGLAHTYAEGLYFAPPFSL